MNIKIRRPLPIRAGDAFGVNDWAGVLASTSICFDLSVFELLVTLVHGGAVVLAESAAELPRLPGQRRRSPHQYRAIGRQARSGIWVASPRAYEPSPWPERPCGNLVQGLYRFDQIDSVYNLYGPSETTTYSTFTRCDRGAIEEPTIGSPIWNTRAYVLDAALSHALGVGGAATLRVPAWLGATCTGRA